MISASARVRNIGRVPVFGLIASTSSGSQLEPALGNLLDLPGEERELRPSPPPNGLPLSAVIANRTRLLTPAKILPSFSKS